MSCVPVGPAALAMLDSEVGAGNSSTNGGSEAKVRNPVWPRISAVGRAVNIVLPGSASRTSDLAFLLGANTGSGKLVSLTSYDFSKHSIVLISAHTNVSRWNRTRSRHNDAPQTEEENNRRDGKQSALMYQ
eukprot:m.442072 g.442072  ORF g.442072 m.442072 type:complete len:131 (-) comp56812_c0_seq6:792-1184(-)